MRRSVREESALSGGRAQGEAYSLCPTVIHCSSGSNAHRRTKGSQMVAKPTIVGFSSSELRLVHTSRSSCPAPRDRHDRRRTRRPAMDRACSSHREFDGGGSSARRCRRPRDRAGSRSRTERAGLAARNPRLELTTDLVGHGEGERHHGMFQKVTISFEHASNKCASLRWL